MNLVEEYQSIVDARERLKTKRTQSETKIAMLEGTIDKHLGELRDFGAGSLEEGKRLLKTKLETLAELMAKARAEMGE